MISYAAPQAVRDNRTMRTISGGGGVCITDYLLPRFPQPGEQVFPMPQAFAVEQSPGSISLPHFHDEDQFQVITQGGGTLGRHAVGALSIHYTNRQTAYGPIVAGETGLTYFTLRQIGTKGIWYLEDSKDKQDRSAAKRQVTAGPLTVAAADQLRALKDAQTDVLIAPHEDGLAAWMLRLPAGASAPAPRHTAGTGSYLMVTGGTMRLEGQDLPPFATAFVSHEEKDFRIVAGDGGLEVLVMQYPGGQRVLERKCRPLAEQGSGGRQGPAQAPGTAR